MYIFFISGFMCRRTSSYLLTKSLKHVFEFIITKDLAKDIWYFGLFMMTNWLLNSAITRSSSWYEVCRWWFDGLSLDGKDDNNDEDIEKESKFVCVWNYINLRSNCFSRPPNI